MDMELESRKAISENTKFMDSEDPHRRQTKPKIKKITNLLSTTFTEFSENSTIHGIRYIGERKRPLYEKMFWIVVYIFALFGCYFLVRGVWLKYQLTPVIVSFSEKAEPVWEIPFPAVTLCSIVKTSSDQLNFSAALNDFRNNGSLFEEDEETHKSFQALLHVCGFGIEDIYLKIIEERGINVDLNVSIIDEILRLSDTDEIAFCDWKDEQKMCNDVALQTLTSDGFCYTFNGLSSTYIYRDDVYQSDIIDEKIESSWTLQNGYELNAGVDTYPRRVFGTTEKSGFGAIYLIPKKDIDMACGGPYNGIKVLLHAPDEVPTSDSRFMIATIGQHASIKVVPDMIRTAPDLKNYNPKYRQCYFDDERYLRYFKVYTQSNCELECLTNWTLKECGCVKFSMPRLDLTKVCDINQYYCLKNSSSTYLFRQLENALQDLEDSPRGHTDCDCLPACTSLNYKAETTQTNINMHSFFESALGKSTEDNFSFDDYEFVMVSVSFEENQFIPSKRSELYGVTDLIANCGGLLALFLGTSAISIIEFIYYYTIRLWTNTHR